MQGAVDEPDEDVLVDLLDGRALDEVRADPPVLLRRIEELVVDPAAVRRLQERVVQEEAEPAAGAQHPSHLGDRLVDVVDVLEHEAGDHGVERCIGERQACRGTADVRRPAAALVGDVDLVPGRVDAHDQLGAELPGEPADLAVAAADVEDPRRAVQLLGGQREDLLDVLGVGTLGEPVDPPAGVVLPELGVVIHGGQGKGASSVRA